MDKLVDKLRQGDRRALARAMSLVDETDHAAQKLNDWLRGRTGDVPWWGFTGPPGVGKSTLVDGLLSKLRDAGRRVGVVAVDPTSPMSGGALLGDRVRMMRHAVDRDVFIRSLATHHCAGGLSDATLPCARLLEVAGYDPVLIETVGVGQSAADITSVADICVVLLGPGYGDDIQLIKAGLLEIADLVAINKFDLPGARRLLTEVRAALEPAPSGNSPEIFGIAAKTGRGVDDLLAKLLETDRRLRDPQQRARRKRRRVLGEIRRGALRACVQALERNLADPPAEDLLAKLERGEVALQDVVNLQLSAIREKAPPPTGNARHPEPEDGKLRAEN
jgi:LAO/AO transport system kinase